jgi:1-acyl-sn-glycerol-3-phosphate acyltransferase
MKWDRDYIYKFGRFLFMLFFSVVFRLRIYDTDKVPQDGGVVFVSNHITAYDPPLLGVAIPRIVDFMAKKELFANPWFARVLDIIHVFPVDRTGNATHAIKESLRRLQHGACIGIFAQGTRNKGDKAALDGAAFIAQRSGVPLQPIAIWRKGRTFCVRFADPIYPEGKRREEASMLTQKVMSAIEAMIPVPEEMPVIQAEKLAG